MHSLYLPLLLIFFFSCDGVRQHLPASELNDFVLNPVNGLRKEILGARSITLEVSYRPKDLIFVNDVADRGSAAQMLVSRRDSLDYFVLSISREGREVESLYASNPLRYNEAISYLSGGIKADISLTSSQRISVLESSYIRGFGASAATNILVVFNSCLDRYSGPFSIKFNDTFFGSGVSEFKFEGQDIRDIPNLRL